MADIVPTLNTSWIGSRYNHKTIDDANVLVLYNSLRGTFARIPQNETTTVRKALSEGYSGFPSGIMADLVLQGFLVPEGTDEARIVENQVRNEVRRSEALHLILMPNENCNFRCVYCSQSFARKKMPRTVIEGVVAYVASRANELSMLTVGWFGGEPLTAPEIIEEISARLQHICREHEVQYGASMTTNGYLLHPRMLQMLIRAEVRRFQITLDGMPENHDRLRVLADRHTGTAERILENLRGMRCSGELFRVQLRVNFDRSSVDGMNLFIDSLGEEFASDGRFFFDFHPVGKWGGPNDSKLRVCGAEEGKYFSLEFARKAAQTGFDLMAIREKLKPFGSRCYAADPHSFVIGSDGTVYKCTVAFEDPRNQVGRLTADGKLLLNETKHRLWIQPGSDTVEECSSCSFRPACHGNACPLTRIHKGGAACPTLKTNLDQALKALSADCVAKTSAAQTREGESIMSNAERRA